MPVWLEYEFKDTPIHKLHPFTKFVILIVLSLLATFYFDPIYLLIIAAMGTTMFTIARVPKRWILPILPIVIYQFAQNLVFGVAQSNPSLYKVLPPEIAGKVLLSASIPFIGDIRLTVGGFLWAVSATFRIPIIILLTFTFLYTTSINDLIKTLWALRVPHQIIYIVTVAYKFIPDIYRAFSTTIIAQKLRGWNLRSKNPIVLVKRAAPAVIPLTRQTINYVDRVTVSALIRGFGAYSVRCPWKIKLSALDLTLVVLSILHFAVSMYFLIVYGKGLI